MAGLEPAQHAGADAGVLRDIGQGQIEFLADPSRDVTDARGDFGTIDQRPLFE